MKKVKAIFKGKNGSCGYLAGFEYSLIIYQEKGKPISIEKKDGGGNCEYDSIVSFLNNWDNIRNI